MVQIVENLVAGPFETPPFEFYVYRNPGDGETVMGYLSSEGIAHNGGRQVTWSSMPFGVPVRDAYLQALDLARRHGVERVWVNDPEGLFPAASRPRGEVGH